MQRRQFVDKLIRRAGFSSKQEAEAALYAVLVALGDTMAPPVIRRIAPDLPEWLSTPMTAHHDNPPSSFFEEVAVVEGVSVGTAREHAGVVLQALDSELAPEIRTVLRRELPPEVRRLLHDAPPSGAAPVRPGHEPRATLATGRPGSTHPLSESRPTRAHSNSIARAADPHSGTKLSEAIPPTLDPHKKTIATGRPGSEEPLSEADDSRVLPMRTMID